MTDSDLHHSALARVYAVPGEWLPLWVAVLLGVVGSAGGIAAAHQLLQPQAHATARRGARRGAARAGVATEHRPLPASADRTQATAPSGRDAPAAPGRAQRLSPTAPSEPIDCPPVFEVRFASGRARPQGAQWAAQASQLASWLAEHPAATLLVHGHTDSQGSEGHNLALSYRRATAVSELLKAAGVAPERLTPRAFGEYQPLPGTPVQSDANRRVTLEVSGLAGCPAASRPGEHR